MLEKPTERGKEEGASQNADPSNRRGLPSNLADNGFGRQCAVLLSSVVTGRKPNLINSFNGTISE